MPYDPNIPADHADLTGAMFRGQFNGLKDLIDTIPVGPPGQNGSDGTSVTGTVIDNTTTLDPGNPAEASVSWDGANVRFTFSIPRGQDGFSAPPITSFIVDGVTTLNPGEPATANASFDGSSVRIFFGIPRGDTGGDGATGGTGSDGNPGGQGEQGIQGPPGEVTNSQLTAAINESSHNSNAVAALGMTVSDPPTQGEMQQIVNKMDELITALRR